MTDEKNAVKTPELSDSEVSEILFPELSEDKFNLGDKDFSIRVLPWKWEMNFRRFAVPIITEELKVFERAAIAFATNQQFYQSDIGIAAAAGKGEIEGDSYLNNAVITICLSQENKIREAAARGKELTKPELDSIERKYRVLLDELIIPDGNTRLYLREIVRRQSDKHKLLEKLGESLMARLEDMTRLLGMQDQTEVVSLKRDFTRQLRSFIAKAGSTVATVDKSSSQSTASGSEKPPSEKSLTLSETNQTETQEEEAVPVGEGQEQGT
jgi:hypothetical protein